MSAELHVDSHAKCMIQTDRQVDRHDKVIGAFLKLFMVNVS